MRHVTGLLLLALLSLVACAAEEAPTPTTTTTTALVADDPIADLDDDFSDPASLSRWSFLHYEQGAEKPYERLDVDATVAGELAVIPEQSAWYQAGTATLVYQEIAGDFIATARVAATSLVDPGGPPQSAFSSAGLLARDAAAAAGESWLIVELGRQGGQTGSLAKSTVGSVTTRVMDPGAHMGEVRICRVGDEVSLLRRLDGEVAWTELAVFDRPDLPETLQVGPAVTAWAAPVDLLASFDEVAFLRPSVPGDCFTHPEMVVEPEPETGNPLADLNDEFDDPATLETWLIRAEEEQAPSHIALLDIDATTPGAMTIDPNDYLDPAPNDNGQGPGWFQDRKGPLVHTYVTGDFAVMTHVRVGTTASLDVFPSGGFNSAGLLVRDPASYDPADPAALGNEDWIMYNIGQQAGFIGSETKTTFSDGPDGNLDSESSLFLTPIDGTSGQLVMCRVGSEFRFFRRLDGEAEWTQEVHTPENLFVNGGGLPMDDLASGFDRPDLPDTVQVGMMVNRWADAGPDPVRAAFDYIRFWVPDGPEGCLPESD